MKLPDKTITVFKTVNTIFSITCIERITEAKTKLTFNVGENKCELLRMP